jgi:hypothetical protein
MRTFIVLLALAAPLALAQTHDPAAHGAPAGADASGARPGDDALTCEQIQAEMSSLLADPATQRVLAQQQTASAAGAAASAAHPEAAPGLSPEAQAALGGGAARPPAQPPPAADGAPANESAGDPAAAAPKSGGRFKGLGRALGGGAIGAFGGNRAARAEQQRQIEQMGAAGRAAQEAQRPVLEAQQADVAAASPQLTRGMHLAQLGQAKGCGSQGGRGGR